MGRIPVRCMDRRGFTLMELVVVLAVVGMVLALVLPRLPRPQSEDLRSSARGLAATLRYLQDRAVTGRATYVVRMEPGTERLAVLQLSNDGSEQAPDDPLLARNPLKEGIVVADVVLQRRGTISEGEVRLAVGAGGIREFVSIHLRSADGSAWTVMAFPSGGKVKDYNGYRREAL